MLNTKTNLCLTIALIEDIDESIYPNTPASGSCIIKDFFGVP